MRVIEGNRKSDRDRQRSAIRNSDPAGQLAGSLITGYRAESPK